MRHGVKVAGAAFMAMALLTACTPKDTKGQPAATVSPGARKAAEAGGTPKVEYLGSQRLTTSMQYGGTAVGGLSAISYDARSGKYFVISDDRSEHNPARFYAASLKISAKGFESAELTGTHPWLRQDGVKFPPTGGVNVAPDPEGIAVNPRTDQLYWSSEGERYVSSSGATLADPAIRVATTSGKYVKRLPIPKQLEMSASRVGPRRNEALEGLSFTPDGSRLYASMEDPLYQDGADPTAASGALSRVTEYSADKPVAQYAYPIEKLFDTPPSDDSTATNGVSDVVALGGGKLLMLERAVIVETIDWKIRLYLADTAGATNVLGHESLKDGKVQPMRKKLLLDLSDARGLLLDNFEGATLGPRLPDGRRLLVLVTDNNFTWAEVTQFAAFAVSGL